MTDQNDPGETAALVNPAEQAGELTWHELPGHGSTAAGREHTYLAAYYPGIGVVLTRWRHLPEGSPAAGDVVDFGAQAARNAIHLDAHTPKQADDQLWWARHHAATFERGRDLIAWPSWQRAGHVRSAATPADRT